MSKWTHVRRERSVKKRCKTFYENVDFHISLGSWIEQFVYEISKISGPKTSINAKVDFESIGESLGTM
jgi:hypothetical protein